MKNKGKVLILKAIEGLIIPELWETIKYEHYAGKYAISNYGRVKSIARYDTRGNWRKEKLLSWRENGSRGDILPYYHVMFNNKPRSNNYKVHRLVADYFVGGYEEGLTVNHIDGDKGNNFFGNLEWLSVKDNAQHAHDTGLTNPVKGISHGRNKLSEESVRCLYTKHLQGRGRKDFVARELGDFYGVDGRAILSIFRKESWKWFTDSIDAETK